MGMSASQARLLTITARMSDLELSAQQISNAKIRLSVQGEEIARKYSEALNNKVKNVHNPLENISANQLTAYNPGQPQVMLKRPGGEIIVPSTYNNAYLQNQNNLNGFISMIDPAALSDPGKTAYYQNIFDAMKNGGYDAGHSSGAGGDLSSTTWLASEWAKGSFSIQTNKSGAFTASTDYDITSTDTNIFDTSDDKAAEAEYEAKTTEIATKDKMFDLSLRQIDTEHSALQTEYDSVKKVQDKNIERSFKIFGW